MKILTRIQLTRARDEAVRQVCPARQRSCILRVLRLFDDLGEQLLKMAPKAREKHSRK